MISITFCFYNFRITKIILLSEPELNCYQVPSRDCGVGNDCEWCECPGEEGHCVPPGECPNCPEKETSKYEGIILLDIQFCWFQLLSPNAPVSLTHLLVKMMGVHGVNVVGCVLMVYVRYASLLAPISMTQNLATTKKTVNGVVCAMTKDSV